MSYRDLLAEAQARKNAEQRAEKAEAKIFDINLYVGNYVVGNPMPKNWIPGILEILRRNDDD